MSSVELADVVARWRGTDSTRHLSPVQWRALNAITDCRTPKLGRHAQRCLSCAALTFHYHSCRNRHCPKCQAIKRQRWVDARTADLLPVRYYHLVFTVPHALNPLIRQRPGLLYETLFNTVAGTLKTFGADPRWLGGELSATLVLHTWSQTLERHVHIHALVAAGALSADLRWIPAKRGFLFPVRALSRVYRGKFLDALRRCDNNDKLVFTDEDAKELRKSDWVVYARQPLAGPKQVIDYLARYTHRTAIGNERLVDLNDGKVRFIYRDRRRANRTRTMQLSINAFMTRFVQHILPGGFMRIRHYGILANRCKRQKLAQCRTALNAQAPPAHDPVDVATFMQHTFGVDISVCKHCNSGKLVPMVGSIMPTGPPT